MVGIVVHARFQAKNVLRAHTSNIAPERSNASNNEIQSQTKNVAILHGPVITMTARSRSTLAPSVLGTQSVSS